MKKKKMYNCLRLTVVAGLISFNASAAKLEDSLLVYVNDSVKYSYKVNYTMADTIEGKVEAVYDAFPGKKAFTANYYNKWRTGVYTSYYPTGQKMETIIYQKGKRNGEYTLYDTSGIIIIKGLYVNDVKDGFWNYRKYQFYGKYKNGKKHGTWKWISPEGDKKKIFFKNGTLAQPLRFKVDFPRFILLN